MLQTGVERRIGSPVRKQLLVFLGLGFLLLPFYRYELGPDGISYLSIAEQYAGGFWHEAINAYWGPLYSWLLAVLMLLHVPGIFATRIVGLASGAVSLYALSRLSVRFPMRPALQQTLLWLAALILLSFVVQSNTPDTLFTALLLLYTTFIFDPDYPTPHAGIICGILGALSFYTKSYGFAFFLCHFCLFSFTALFLRRNRLARRQIVQQFASGLACFLVLSACWILVLQSKYGIWTIGTTGEFNHRLVGPGSAGYPHLRGLVPPPSEHALTSWQDPSPGTLPAWSALADARHELKLIALNTKETVYFWGRESILFPIFLIAYIVLCLGTKDRRWEWVYPALTICLFSAGYLFLTVADRYFWYPELLILLIAFRSLDLLFEKVTLATMSRLALIAITVLSFAVSPLRGLRGHFRRDAVLYATVQTMKASGKMHERFASCGNWAQSAYFAYLLHEPYYGVVVPEAAADEIARELNPDFNAAPQPAPAASQARQALSSAHVYELLLWPDCPIDAASLGSVVARSGEMKVVRFGQ